MTDVIDRGKLLATLRANLAAAISRHDGGDYEDEIRYAIRAVEGAEGVDAVDVVRCRECEHRYTFQCAMHMFKAEWTADNSFCSWGEHKEAEGQKDG